MTVRRAALCAASFLALAAAPAWGQNAAPSVEGGSADEIVVTAQLREQDPVEVPIAVSALTGNELSRLGVEDFEEFSRFIPGFEVQNQSPNNPGFVMRGITSDSGSAFNEPRVSVFQDGVSISKSRGSYVELFDVERVEVSKGPQSTLYGRGALIGAVNIVQNKADPDGFYGMARADYGNYDQYIAEGMLNVPLAEGTALRVSGRYRKRDGYVENLLGGPDFNSADTGAIRGSFHVEREKLTFDLIGNYQKDTPNGTAFKSIAFTPTDPTTGTVIGTRGRNSGAALAPGAGFEDGRRLGLDREVWGFTGIARYAFSDTVALTSITAYREFDALETFDADGLSLPILTAAEDARGKQTSQELRLSFEEGPITAFVGGSYFRETGSQRTPAQFDERALLARLAGRLSGPSAARPGTDPAPAATFASTAFTGALLQGIAAASGVALPAAQAQAIAANLKPAHYETSTNSSRTTAFDIFGDVTYKLGERFELGAGLRYTHDDKRSRYTASVLNGRSVLGGLIGALSQPAATRAALLGALAVPGAATIPPSAAYPVPLFGLGAQPTAANGAVDTATLKDDGFSWRLTARYAATEDASLYATYARGRRPRVLAASSPAAPFGATRFNLLPNERVDSYEAGFKTALAARTLLLDGAVFYYDYRNFQTTVQQGTQVITTNAGKAESYGFEGQARYVPSDALTVYASYAYNHSRLKAGVRDGNRFRLSPDHSAALGVILSQPLGGGRISFAPSATYQSRVYFDDDNDLPALQQPPAALVADLIRDETQKGFALVNARLGYGPEDGGWRIEAFVENAFDKKYTKDAGNTGDALGLPTFIAGDPRYYGVSATIRFGAR
ncbi:TonB-dependent receptor [Sphingomonas jatrophae]|uniref:Outer membrane receptor proteins, mostly Fe transport n=1 Tax=Sphingomonas jatrophae TaxID=1166337 RepID=A0A1I6JFC6_9SPHN|nr:TonB-dependent receptor [Sphingomonas jatrophae]SFR77310.1 Outer membrane receptor proteins, mostly Fe transport [Sphingomonas jatrophae]